MNDYQRMTIAHATGANSYTPNAIAQAGIASGLTKTIAAQEQGLIQYHQADEVLAWLMDSTVLTPHPTLGELCYLVVEDNRAHFIFADCWAGAFICIRFRKMIDKAPHLACLYEAVQELEDPSAIHQLLLAPTSERFPASKLCECLYGESPPTVRGFTSTDGVRSVLRIDMRQVCRLMVSAAFRIDHEATTLFLQSTGIIYQIDQMETIPLIILAAMAWRELHLPE